MKRKYHVSFNYVYTNDRTFEQAYPYSDEILADTEKQAEYIAIAVVTVAGSSLGYYTSIDLNSVEVSAV